MSGVSKIEKFFNKNNWCMKYKCCEARKHIGGRSFYNDGTYLIDKYELRIDGKKFELLAKVTGRPLYWIISDGKELAVSFNQSDLLQYFQLNCDMYGNRIY